VLNRRLTSSIIIALVISGVFTLWLSQKFTKTHTAPPPPRSQYVTASANLEAGQMLRAENLHLVDWPATMPLQGAYTNTQALVGRVVLYPLAAGEPILERQLSSPGTSNGITVKIPDGMRAISLRTDEVVGVAGFLLPGTHVDVLVTLHVANIPDPITTTVLQNAQVIAAGQKTEPDPDGKPDKETVVTILVTPDDAQRVDLAATQGTVHFVLRNGSDKQQVEGKPVLLSQLSGMPTTPPPSEKSSSPTVHAAPKPYTVETFMGPTVKTENFQ
jgi:pilus assembly protein CpaB